MNSFFNIAERKPSTDEVGGHSGGVGVGQGCGFIRFTIYNDSKTIYYPWRYT